MSLIDEDIRAEIEEFPDEDKKEDNNNENKEEDNKENKKVDDEQIDSGGESESEEGNKEIEVPINENIPLKNIKDNEQIKYMKVKNYIQSKEPIQIEIYIPKFEKSDKIEKQLIRRNFKLSTGNSNCEVEI